MSCRLRSCLCPLCVALALAVSFGLRYSSRDFESADYKGFFLPYYDAIKSRGGFQALDSRYGNSTALYLYVLAFLTYLPLPALYAIKLFSVVFDYMAAFWVYKLVRLRHPGGPSALLAFVVVIFAPTVILNGSFWGQWDIVYTSFLLAALYYFAKAIREESQNAKYNAVGMAMFGVAMSAKLQSVFFLFPLVVLLLRRKIPLVYVLIVPWIYFLILLPQLAFGRPFLDAIATYGRQMNFYTSLTLGAPSIFAIVPAETGRWIGELGMVITTATIFLLAWHSWFRRSQVTPESLVRASMVSVLVIPYLLPCMHERYFFPADVIGIVFAFYVPRYWFVPVLVGSISLMSYMPYLFGLTVLQIGLLSAGIGTLAILVIGEFISYSSTHCEGLTKAGAGERGIPRVDNSRHTAHL